MFRKLLVKILLGNKNSFTKAIKLKGKVYVFNIEEYKPVYETIKEWQGKVL